jgi:hypothetical protein
MVKRKWRNTRSRAKGLQILFASLLANRMSERESVSDFGRARSGRSEKTDQGRNAQGQKGQELTVVSAKLHRG